MSAAAAACVDWLPHQTLLMADWRDERQRWVSASRGMSHLLNDRICDAWRSTDWHYLYTTISRINENRSTSPSHDSFQLIRMVFNQFYRSLLVISCFSGYWLQNLNKFSHATSWEGLCSREGAIVREAYIHSARSVVRKQELYIGPPFMDMSRAVVECTKISAEIL